MGSAHELRVKNNFVPMLNSQITFVLVCGKRENEQYEPAFCCPVEARFRCVGEVDRVSFRVEIFGEHFRHFMVTVNKQDLVGHRSCGIQCQGVSISR